MWILNAFPGGFHTNSLLCPLPQAPRLDESTVHNNYFSNIASNKELGVGRWGLPYSALHVCDHFCKKIRGSGVGKGDSGLLETPDCKKEIAKWNF